MTPPRSFFVLTLLGCLLALLAGAAYQLTAAEAATCDQSSTKKCDPNDKTPPTVQLTSPDRHAPGQYTSIQKVVEITATATDNQDIDNVKFYAGSIPLGTDTEAPYEARFDTKVWPDWQTSFVKAVATDTNGNTSEDLLYVQVVRTESIPTPIPGPTTTPGQTTPAPPNTQPSTPTPDTRAPSVKLTSPGAHAPGEYTSISGVISVEAEAADDVGVTRVDFYAGSIALGSVTSAPWRVSFDTSVWPIGQVSFVKAIAHDGTGNRSDHMVYVRVVSRASNPAPATPTTPTIPVAKPTTPAPDTEPSPATPDRRPPRVTLTSPGRHAPGQYTSISGVITVEADASDDVGVRRVEFFAGSIALGSATTAPWRASFDTSVWPLGQVSFVKAIAHDGSGNKSSDMIYVQVVRSTGSATPGPATPGGATPAACADRKDNDGDGKIDYPADTGCANATDNDETNAVLAACQDGKDNDGDGKIDYPADTGCANATDNDETNAVLAACQDGKDNDGDGKIDYPADTGCANATDNDETNALGAGPKLAWAPPQLSSPITVTVPATGGLGSLDPSRDYVLNLGHRRTGLEIVGGRNVVVMGGRVTCESIIDSNLSSGRGIVITDTQGTIHLEGVLFENCSDGIAVSAPTQAIVQVQNVRFQDIDSPWNLSHPDVIQTWNGPREVRIDRLTADFSSKGFLWMSTTGTFPRRVDQRHVNFRLWSLGGSTPDGPATYTWHPSSSTRSTCQDCWSEMGWWQNVYRRRLQDGWGTFDKPAGGWEFIPYRVVGADGRRVEVETQGEHDSLVNDDLGRRRGDYMERLTPSLAGERWHWGLPGGGDFVPQGLPGTGYVSPGYA